MSIATKMRILFLLLPNPDQSHHIPFLSSFHTNSLTYIHPTIALKSNRESISDALPQKKKKVSQSLTHPKKERRGSESITGIPQEKEGWVKINP